MRRISYKARFPFTLKGYFLGESTMPDDGKQTAGQTSPATVADKAYTPKNPVRFVTAPGNRYKARLVIAYRSLPRISRS